MNAFRPTLSGLAPAFQPEVPRPAPPSTEIIDLATTRTNADRILALIFDAGGSMSGADLRAALDDLDQPERAKAVGLLRNEGKIRSEGSTLQIRYHLVDWKRPTTAASTAPPRRLPCPATPQAPAAVADPITLEFELMRALLDVVTGAAYQALDVHARARSVEWLASRIRSGHG